MNAHIEKFERGTRFVDIVSPVTKNELTELETSNAGYTALKCMKFIPASGAATRMFQDLYSYLDGTDHSSKVETFFENLEAFPFYDELSSIMDAGSLDKSIVDGRKKIIDCLLNEGLCYGSLPKALLKFHKYDNDIATPIDEHIFEGENYLSEEAVNLHFTISKEHEEFFNDYMKKAIGSKTHIDVTYSFQKKETDTLAVDMDNHPFKLDNGEVLYRAGGHGSLIENLNDLDGDVIFIKNIDNVCHQSKVQDTIDSKKKLASIGYEVKLKLDGYINDILADDYDLDEICAFMKDVLNIDYKIEVTKDMALKMLDRPLRVCGMVRSEGDPGGGPFLVDNGDYTDLQICETVEIDHGDPVKEDIFQKATFFNPVDLVCFTRNYEGKKYNLLGYVNQDRYFISEKSYKGRRLKALEHPGLWNGAMHNWNTLFVEVPVMTFNPVKTVNDLLKEGHVGQ